MRYFDLEEIATQVVDAAYHVHKELGPGLLESIYENCIEIELRSRGLQIQRQVSIPIYYKNNVLRETLRIDLLVEKSIILEIKSVSDLNEVHHAQLLTYLKLTGKNLGFLINFNVALIRKGIRRIIRS